MFKPIPKKEADAIVDKYMKELNVRPADPDRPVKNLSGGNQQKVLIGRWLATHPELLILDEPTRGIDIGAKAEIQQVVLDLASQGMGVSSSPPSLKRSCVCPTTSRFSRTATRSQKSKTTTPSLRRPSSKPSLTPT